jgi:hypothetical protein
MPQFGGKNAKKKTSSSSTKRHFTVVIGSKEHGLYVSSSPSSAARKAVSKLCATDKKKKVQFSIREITQGSKKKTYGPYDGYIEKLKEPIELKGCVIRYKPVAKLSGKTGKVKGGGPLDDFKLFYNENIKKAQYKLKKMTEDKIFNELSLEEKNNTLFEWAQEWNNKIFQKLIDLNNEYSIRLVKMIQEGKITIFIPKKEINHQGAEYVTIDFSKIDDIIPKTIDLSRFVNSSNNNGNSAAGPAKNSRLLNSRNREKDLSLGSASELHLNNKNNNKNKIQFPRRRDKAKTKLQLNALVKYFNIINKYYKIWSEYNSSAVASQSDFDGILRSELLKTFKNITDDDINGSLGIIKEYFNILKELKEYIDISIHRHPTWGVDLTVDKLYETPGILTKSSTKSNFIDHSDQHLNSSVKLLIPDYYIGNWSNKEKNHENTTNRRPVRTGYDHYKTTGNRIMSYKESLERLANTLHKKGIKWNDKTDVFVNSVINFLKKYYQDPTPNQLDIAVKIVRMSLLPTRSRIPYRQIFTGTF